MSRYIDANLMKENHLMSDDCNNCEQNPRECQHNYIYTKMDFCEWIDDEPTADVVEVVRCKDCEYWQTDWIPNHGGDRGCHYCEMMDTFTEPLNYCGDAERKILPNL